MTGPTSPPASATGSSAPTTTAPTPRLYDLDADPGEKTNLASREPQRVEAMRAPLLAWYQQMPDSKRDRGAAAEKPE